jgi:glycosyltransferase involved in cell wall biosynthesis
VILLHDVFPENVVAGNMLKNGSFVYSILKKIFNKAYNQADKLIVVGSDMSNLIKRKLTKEIPIEVITNWADHEQVLSLNMNNYHKYYGLPQQADDQVFIQFAGNIGRVQGLEMFFRLIAKSKNREFNLIIIGDGAMKPSLAIIADQCHLNNVHFFDSKSRSEQCAFLNNMDIGLVTLSPGMYGLGVPSKVYNIFSAGKPVLFIGDEGAEIAEYIRLYNVGWAFDWKQEEEIQSFLETIGSVSKEEIKLKGYNARLLVERKFNQKTILAAYEQSVSF